MVHLLCTEVPTVNKPEDRWGLGAYIPVSLPSVEGHLLLEEIFSCLSLSKLYLIKYASSVILLIWVVYAITLPAHLIA